jgi:hypothetical protein
MRNFIFFLAGFLLVSCSGKIKVPPGIIQQKTMQKILWDVLRAQVLSAELARRDSSVNEASETRILTHKIFELYNTTPSAFDESYSWYTSHPEMMRLIFDSMNLQNQRQNELKMKQGYRPLKASPIKKQNPAADSNLIRKSILMRKASRVKEKSK